MSRSVEDRFWSKVRKAEGDGCWEWTGEKNAKGYGVLYIKRQKMLAHRMALMLEGADLIQLCVLHRCDNPPCVRPSHLYPGTRTQNNQDREARNRTALGEDNGKSKLTAEAVRYIRSSHEDSDTLAAKFAVARRTINSARSGASWRHVAQDNSFN